jgi:hypothetical protein
MGLVNFKLLNQSFYSPYQNKNNHGFTTCMKVKKKIKELEKKIGFKGLKGKKVVGLTFALVLHH